MRPSSLQSKAKFVPGTNQPKDSSGILRPRSRTGPVMNSWMAVGHWERMFAPVVAVASFARHNTA